MATPQWTFSLTSFDLLGGRTRLSKKNWFNIIGPGDCGLWRMQSVEEMADFVLLWDSVQGSQLSNTPDSIAWKWTADGVYTAKSAYEAQFLGSYSPFRGEFIWQAEAEGKHRFFAWLLVQSKILTADNFRPDIGPATRFSHFAT